MACMPSRLPTADKFAPAALVPVVRSRVEPRTSDRVFDRLFSAIRDLALPPGTLLSESELARQLQVSRTPIREAIVRLAAANLVEVLPQVGTRVAPIRMADVEEARFVRENLELAALDLVCADPARDVSSLHELLDRQKRAHREGDLDAFFAADEAMHIAIFTLAGYPGAWQAVQRTKVQLDRLRRLSLPEPSTIKALIDEHRRIVQSLETGSAEAARDLLRVHARRALVHAPALRRTHPDYFAE